MLFRRSVDTIVRRGGVRFLSADGGYATSYFREWTPPHTSSIEESLRLTKPKMYGEDHFGHFFGATSLLRSPKKETMPKMKRGKSFASYAGVLEQIFDVQQKYHATYAGMVDDSSLDQDSTTYPRNMTKARHPLDRNSMVAVAFGNFSAPQKKRIARNHSSQTRRTLKALEESRLTFPGNANDPYDDTDGKGWGTPRCTVP